MEISDLFSPLFLIKILFCFCDAQQGAAAVCHAGKGSSPGQVTTCVSSHCESVCLVCGDHLTKGVKWIMADTLIAQGEFTFGVISGSKVNKCNGNSTSLSVYSCDGQIRNTIRCELDDNVLAEFRLKNSAKETLSIVGDTLQNTGYNKTLVRGLNVSLLCFIQSALPPVTLEWLVDEKTMYRERFTSNETTNFSIPLVINTSTVKDSIICASYRDNHNISQRLLISNSSTAPGTAHIQIGIAVLFVLAALFTIITFFMKRCKSW